MSFISSVSSAIRYMYSWIEPEEESLPFSVRVCRFDKGVNVLFAEPRNYSLYGSQDQLERSMRLRKKGTDLIEECLRLKDFSNHQLFFIYPLLNSLVAFEKELLEHSRAREAGVTIGEVKIHPGKSLTASILLKRCFTPMVENFETAAFGTANIVGQIEPQFFPANRANADLQITVQSQESLAVSVRNRYYGHRLIYQLRILSGLNSGLEPNEYAAEAKNLIMHLEMALLCLVQYENILIEQIGHNPQNRPDPYYMGTARIEPGIMMRSELTEEAKKLEPLEMTSEIYMVQIDSYWLEKLKMLEKLLDPSVRFD